MTVQFLNGFEVISEDISPKGASVTFQIDETHAFRVSSDGDGTIDFTLWDGHKLIGVAGSYFLQDLKDMTNEV
jgi:hypothetical protein